MDKCSICGSTRDVFPHDYLNVDKNERSIRVGVSTIRTSTTETLIGAEHHGICKDCVRKANIEKAKSELYLVGGIAVAAVLIQAGNEAASFIVIALVAAAVAVTIALLIYFLYTRPFAIRWSERTALKEALQKRMPNRRYIEIREGFYRSERDFLSKNYFATDIGRKLYQTLIATGHWRDLLVAQPEAGTQKAKPRRAAPSAVETTPQSETDTLLQRSVQELLRLYRQTPQGFLKDSSAAEPVRAIGRKLDAAGGFQMMLRAHEQFDAANPGNGLARNLEIVWDGIGGWRG